MYLRNINEYKYKESIEIKGNIILDFDENNIPVALEILDAHKFFGVEKYSLKQPIGIKMNIEVGEEKIRVKAWFNFIFHLKEIENPVEVDTVNDIKLPATQTNFATVIA